MASRNTVLCILLTLIVLSISGCHSSSSSNSSGSPIDAVLALNTTGGDDAIGQWAVMDTGLSPLATPVTASGTPTLDAEVVSKTDGNLSTGARAGFHFNRVDGYFYGVLPSTDRQGAEPPSRASSFGHGDVIRFHPGTDAIEHVVTIPYLYVPNADPNTTQPYGDFVTAPVISPDGKSLLLVARQGGQPIPLAPDGLPLSRTIGGIVHLDIDPASPDYRKFTPVYDFHDYGVGQAWFEQLERVETQPLLVETPVNGPVLFLVTNSRVTGINEINPSEPLSLVPSNANDWSQPWNLLGSIVTQFVQPAQNVYYDPYQNEFWWAAELINDSISEDTKIFRRSGPDGAVEFNTTFIPKTYGAKTPQAMFVYPGIGRQLFTAGSGPNCNPLNPSDDQCRAKVFDVELADTQVVRTVLNSYWTGNLERQLPAGLASSVNTGYHFLNAVANYSVIDLNFFTGGRKKLLADDTSTPPSTNPYLSWTLDELYADADILPSRLDRYNFSNFALARLYEGTAEKGYMLIGSPAIGGLVSEPVNDRYVVSLAIHGGANGAGAIIKHDRLTNTTTSIALGTAMPSAPIGKAIQLDNGALLGGTYRRARAGLFPQRPAQGVWVQAADAATPMVDYELPATDHPCFGGTTCLADAEFPPFAFVRAADGSIWATTQYEVWNATGNFQVIALLAFDSQTGKPTGEVHVLSDSPSLVSGLFTEVSASGNILTYLTSALQGDGVTDGQRLWLVDLADRDGNNTPASNTSNPVILSPEGGAAGTAWGVYFAPALQASTGHFYFMTEATVAGSEAQIHRLELGATVADTPTITTVVTGETRLAGTPLFEASNGLFYYGTRDGRLMSFNAATDAVTEIADLTASGAGMTSDVRGFLSEISPGMLTGIVVDSSTSQSEVASRAFRYDIAVGGVPTTVDVSDFVSVQDEFPGLLPISYSP